VDRITKKIEAVGRLVTVQILFELEKKLVCKYVLGESCRVIFISQQAENIIGHNMRSYGTVQGIGAMLPGICTGEQGCGAGCGEISSGMVVVVYGCLVCKPFKVRTGIAVVTVK
ncbi:unnamed protein product, partial [marine sediment metagenome]